MGRAMGAIALALLALGVCASMAGADPLAMKFTETRGNVGVQLSDAVFFGPPATAPFEAQIDPGSGSITAGALHVPDFSTHITEPINADVTVHFEIGPVTGSFIQTTGALTLEGEAAGTLTSEGKACKVSTVPAKLAVTTAGNSGGTSPRSGAPFTAGLTGPGAIAGQWSSMHATPIEGKNISFCENVEGRIEGPGGVWLKQEGVVPPPPPSSTPCVVPKLVGKKLGRAKSALKRADCKLGKVQRPKHSKGKRRGALVVKSSNPGAGASPVDGRVDLWLGHMHRKAHRY
jgi:hypothetical protein